MRQKRTDESYKFVKKRCVALLICVTLCLCVLLSACGVQADSSAAPGSSSLPVTSAPSLTDSDTSAIEQQVYKTLNYMDEYPIEVLYEDICPLMVQDEGAVVRDSLLQEHDGYLYYMDIGNGVHHLRRRNLGTGEDTLVFDVGAEYTFYFPSRFVVMNEQEVLMAVYEGGDTSDMFDGRYKIIVCNMQTGERQILKEYLGQNVETEWGGGRLRDYRMAYWPDNFFFRHPIYSMSQKVVLSSKEDGHIFEGDFGAGRLIDGDVYKGNLFFVGEGGDCIYMVNRNMQQPVKLLRMDLPGPYHHFFQEIEAEGNVLRIRVRGMEAESEETIIHYDYVAQEIVDEFVLGECEDGIFSMAEGGYDWVQTVENMETIYLRYDYMQLTCFDENADVLYSFPPFELGESLYFSTYLRVDDTVYYYVLDEEDSLRLASVKAQ